MHLYLIAHTNGYIGAIARIRVVVRGQILEAWAFNTNLPRFMPYYLLEQVLLR